MLPFDGSTYSFDPIVLNLIAGAALQRMKVLPQFSWISEHTPKLLVFVRTLLALCTAAGMSISWAYTDGSGTITVTGITIASVLSFLWSVTKNYVVQRGAEVGLDIQRMSATSVRNQRNNLMDPCDSQAMDS